jgi:hypothetical protein
MLSKFTVENGRSANEANPKSIKFCYLAVVGIAVDVTNGFSANAI